MLNEIIDAVLSEEKIMLKLAKGELKEDREGILWSKEGKYDLPANAQHFQNLTIYDCNPKTFRLIDAFSSLLSPLTAYKINKYCDRKQNEKGQHKPQILSN